MNLGRQERTRDIKDAHPAERTHSQGWRCGMGTEKGLFPERMSHECSERQG